MSITDRRVGVVPSTAIKAPCDAATTANITLSGLQTIDGIAVVEGNRVLVVAQTNPVDNGIWNPSTGAWSRSADASKTGDFVDGTLVTVSAGTINDGVIYRQTETTPVIGTGSITFIASSALSLPAVTANTMLVDNAAGTARESKTFTQIRDILDVGLIYQIKADAAAATIPNDDHALRLNGGTTMGDGLGGLYIDTNNGNADTFVSSGGTARTWYLAPERFQQDPDNQSGGGTTATIERSLALIVTERVSIYDYIPENIQADIRTGLHSSSVSPYFSAAVTHLNPGGSSIPGGAQIHIPRGKYLVDSVSGIPIQDSIEWIGENKEGTRIQAMGNNPIFKSVGTSANQVGRAAIKNMTLVGDGKTHLSGYGIELVWMNNPLIEDIQFQALRWCVVQEYVVNAFIFGCSSSGSVGTIRGYLWKKAIDSLLFSGFDNTTTISDCYFQVGDLAMVLHGSNGIQMGGNVAMLQGGVRVGAIAETLADGTAFTPGADNDVIHFQHWDGLRLDTVTNDRAIRVVKGAMSAPHDFRLSSLWAGNIAGTNSYVCDFDGLEDFSITCANIDVTGQTPFWFNNCKRGSITGVSVRSFGGNNGQNAVLIQNSESIAVTGNSFNVHTSATTADGVRAESSSRIRVVGNDFDFRSISPTGSTARRSILVDTTDSVVADNSANDRASYPCVESGTSNYNRIHDNPSTVEPTITGANSGGHDNVSGGYLTGSATYDPPSLVDGTGAQANVTISGAALGDFAVASFSNSTSSISLTSTITAANQGTARFQNESGSTIDLASGTLTIRAFKL